MGLNKVHTEWRDCQEWRKYNLHLGTTSNEAAKLYDATLTQYIGWYEEDSLGGIEATVEKLLNADPNWVMGHVLANGLDLMGTGRSPHLDPEFKVSLAKMEEVSQGSQVGDQERKHAKAITLFAEGKQLEACGVWENILLDNPLDMLALKYAHDSYFYLGLQPQMRDCIARVMPHWKTDMPLYGYLLGMHSFGLVETNFYEQAEKVARKGLEINRSDAWSTHSLAHVLEMTGRQDEGITFLSSTLQDWKPCGMLACHNLWHWAIYHIEKGEYQGALDIFDSEVAPRFSQSGAMLDMVDASSLLWRLEMEGQKVGARWSDIYEGCRSHLDDHLLVFNDVHLLMSCLGSDHMDTAANMMTSLRTFVTEGSGQQREVMQRVGAPLCEAFSAYKEGNYGRAVNLLSPLKYEILTIGGSNAQRDIFNLFLINAAIKSSSPAHQKLARHLLVERKALKESAPMTDRMIARAMAAHAH